MIGLMFLVGIGLWLAVATILSRRIPRWLGVTRWGTAISVLLFPIVLVAPVADEIIGRWQFNRLCEREAVVTLSPDWVKVKRAKDKRLPTIPLDDYSIPIRVQRGEYIDLDTGQPFFAYKAFHTNGGLLFGRLGIGLGQTISCWPENLTAVMNEMNTDQLLKQGNSK